MNAVFWIFMAFAAAIVLFASIQNDLPKELDFLKNDGRTAVVQQPASDAGSAGAQLQVQHYQGWTIRSSGTAVELTRPLDGHIEVDGLTYANPEIGILCNAGQLDMRIDSRMSTTGAQKTPVTVSGMGEQMWPKGTGKNIFPAQPGKLMEHLLKNPSASFTLSYEELGRQTVRLDAKALPALTQNWPPSCKR